jgi:pimeloyl-ACP methyl ester carboxylesterase
MRASEGVTPSPFLATYLGWQRPSAFDALFIYPDDDHSPLTAVVFLHGFAGNFTYQCWLVGQAGRAAGVLTVCPSMRWSGDWWSEAGEATARATILYLRQQGVANIYLAGLSNGGVGASQLAPRLEADLEGLILISGLLPAAEQTGLPVLIIHSREDERMPVARARAYAAAAGERATYVEMTGDHFLLAKNPAETQTVIAGWLRRWNE